MPSRDIKVVKVSLPDNQRYREYAQSFPRMGRLYLELLENKSKIKQDLINRDYIPMSKDSVIQPSQRDEREEYREEREERREERREEEPMEEREYNKENKGEEHSSVSTPTASPSTTGTRTPQISRSSSRNSEEQLRAREDNHTRTTSRTSSSSRASRASEDSRDSRDSRATRASASSAISVRLKELLQDEEEDKYSRSQPTHLPPSRHLTPYQTMKSPPTLAELRAKGQYEGGSQLRDINHVPISEQELEDKKRELLFKYDLLKKSYPASSNSIPEYTIHSDYEQMKKGYDATVKRLSLDSTVDNYKQYLIGGFMMVEFIMGNFLGFDMQGFTQQQITSMNSYERLLIELGEKSYVPTGSKWPVELRLLFLIIVNAGFFVVSKMILKKTGANLLGMINGMNMNNNSTSRTKPTASSPLLPKRRMRGPTIDIDDIPDAEVVA